MKFEITKKVKTPDGVEHDSAEAAHKHMWMRNLQVLGAADSALLQVAIDMRDNPEEFVTAEVTALRHAIREVFLAAWPRASKGQPRKPREAASEAPKGSEGQPSDDATQGYPEGAKGVVVSERHMEQTNDAPAQAAPKRNHGKKAA